MSLSKFLKTEANLHAREELFNYRLLFDLKTEAASQGFHLQSYHSDVDHEGFDVILDNAINLRKIQVKTVHSNDTNSWQIHKSILRPTANNNEAMGFDYQRSWGVEGGVVLIEYKLKRNEQFDVSYFFSDIYVVNAIALELLCRQTRTKNAAIRVREHLAKGKPNDKINLARGLFIRAASPHNLLSLMGLSRTPQKDWHNRVRTLSSEEWGPKGEVLSHVIDGFRDDFEHVIKEVSGHEAP